MKFIKKLKTFSKMVAADFEFVFLNAKVIKNFFKVKGKVLEFEIRRDTERNAVKIVAKAKMELFNDRDSPITIINPKYLNQSALKRFAITEQDCKAKNFQWNSSPSNDEPVVSRAFNELLEKLYDDQPIEDLILKIPPEDIVQYEERIVFEFDTSERKTRWDEIKWTEFRAKAHKFWFSFDYRLPEDIELLKPKLLEIAPEIFDGVRNTAIYIIHNNKLRQNYFNLETEPIFIDFREAAVDETK